MNRFEAFNQSLSQFEAPQTGRQPRIFQTSLDDDLLIRHVRSGAGPEYIEKLDAHSDLLDELWRDYGIEHSGYVLLRPEGDVLRVATERVAGSDLASAIREKDPEAVHAADQLCMKLVTYLGDKTRKSEKYLGDIYGFDQYMFSLERGAAVLVDVDEMVGNETGEAHPDMCLELAFLYQTIVWLQTTSGQEAESYAAFGELLVSVVTPEGRDEFMAILRRKYQIGSRLTEPDIDLSF